jgi:hypothetical protein
MAEPKKSFFVSALQFFRESFARSEATKPAAEIPAPAVKAKPLSLEDISLDDLKQEKLRLEQVESDCIRRTEDLEIRKRELFADGVETSSERKQYSLARKIKQIDNEIIGLDQQIQIMQKQLRVFNGLIQVKERSLLLSSTNTILQNLNVEELIRYIDRISIDTESQKEKFGELFSKIKPYANIEPKYKILFLSADPTDSSRLRLGEEFREIQEKLKLAKFRDIFKLELPQLSLQVGNISQALFDSDPQIVHFSGHGSSTGELWFENKVGLAQPVQPEALASLFEQFSDKVECVLLNACYSITQAKAISSHIKYVIGMSREIGDKAAIAFAVGFYRALGANRTIEEAYKFGCVEIKLEGIPEALTPILIKT